ELGPGGVAEDRGRLLAVGGGLEPPASTNGDAQHGPGPGPNGITPAAGPATDREQAPSIFGNAPRPELDPDALAPGGRRPPMPPADVDHDGFPITQAVPRIEPRDEPPLPDHDVGFDLPQPGPGQPDILEPDHAEASAAGAASAEAGSWDEFMSGQAADEWSGPATAADTIISDDTIQLAIDGQNYVFVPGVDVTIGRDPSCLVNLDERHALVSRHHLRIEHRDGNWWIEDHSSKGTYIDGRRISAHYKAEGAFLAHLGDDDAGTPMRIITAGEHKAPRSFNTLLVVAMAAVVLLAVAALAFVLLGSRNGGDETTVTAGSDVTVAAPVPGADLARAKQATVILLAEEGFGSGFFVTENLIVTNQHVAVLADELAVGVSRTVDEPAQAEFLAETVAVHPYLDIAVMKLTVDAADSPVSTSGLEPVPIGDSGGLTLGDEVYNTGFPQDLSPAGFDDMGDILLPAVSATSGEAANFSIWPGCSNPTRDEFIPTGSPPGVGCAPDGDITRAVVITTFSSGEGASGSPVFSGDAVVAVVFSGPEGNENAGRNIATAAFADWLDQVIAENG
ncbi:MAG: trypsin-like peptidase domain-containing protein, partial [Actinomycetota bacterium]